VVYVWCCLAPWITESDEDVFWASDFSHRIFSLLFFLRQYADIVDLMVQGPRAELEKLKGPLAELGPSYYPLVAGSLRSRKMW
jgi:hypothetical protein